MMNLYESIKNNLKEEEFPNPTYGDDIDKIMSRYTAHNKDWLSTEDIDWLSTQNHLDKLNELSMNYNATGDVEDDERNLNNLASDYFYDTVGIYNENIDSLCTKWAHDQANKIQEAINKNC